MLVFGNKGLDLGALPARWVKNFIYNVAWPKRVVLRFTLPYPHPQTSVGSIPMERILARRNCSDLMAIQ
jgi:hypothetical protein